MDTSTTTYVILLAVAVGLTFMVGGILVRAGQPFLQEVFHDSTVTRSVNTLLSVLFHLITLGVLAIISVTDVPLIRPETALQQFVARLGIVLLTLGFAYGVCMLVLMRVRERRRQAEFSSHVEERLSEQAAERRDQAAARRDRAERSRTPADEDGE